MQSPVQPSCDFPLFRARFLGGALWTPVGEQQQGMGERPHRPSKPKLDLPSLPTRDDGPPSETQLRRQKYQFFEKQCSEIAPGLFLSGDWVAKNWDLLSSNGVTHVVNCVGFVCQEYFRGKLNYKTYFLQDTPSEDILCVLYDAFEYIDNALKQGGRVLVHCSQGVSRSATLVIAYLMWKEGASYDDIFARVKAVRGIANPNIGFTCQLLQWQKRRNNPPPRMRMYRIAPHCPHAPLLLVPRSVTPPKQYATHTWRELDPRGAFIIQTPSRLYIWIGAQCPESHAVAAKAVAGILPKYEAALMPGLVTGAGSAVEVPVYHQGSEPADFIALMDPPALDPDAERQNARRASITGDLVGALSFALPGSSGEASGPGQTPSQPSAASSLARAGSHAGPGGVPAALNIGRSGLGLPPVAPTSASSTPSGSGAAAKQAAAWEAADKDHRVHNGGPEPMDTGGEGQTSPSYRDSNSSARVSSNPSPVPGRQPSLPFSLPPLDVSHSPAAQRGNTPNAASGPSQPYAHQQHHYQQQGGIDSSRGRARSSVDGDRPSWGPPSSQAGPPSVHAHPLMSPMLVSPALTLTPHTPPPPGGPEAMRISGSGAAAPLPTSAFAAPQQQHHVEHQVQPQGQPGHWSSSSAVPGDNSGGTANGTAGTAGGASGTTSNTGRWIPKEVDEYSPDFTLFADAVRASNAAATSTCAPMPSVPGVGPPVSAPIGLGHRVDGRMSCTGTTGEGGHGMGLLMLGNMQGGGSGLGYLSPQAPGPLLHQKSALEASAVKHAASNAPLSGSILVRPDSPATLEGRQRKHVKRAVGGADDQLAMLMELEKAKRPVQSFHESMDDDA